MAIDEGYGESLPAEFTSLQPAADSTLVLDLSSWPPIYLSDTHFLTEDLHELEEEIETSGAALTFDITEAGVILSKVSHKKRAQLDLRGKGLWTKEIGAVPTPIAPEDSGIGSSQPPSKKRKHDELETASNSKLDVIVIEDSSTESESEIASPKKKRPAHGSPHPARSQAAQPSNDELGRLVQVVKTEWFTASKVAGYPIPIDPYITFQGRAIPPPVAGITTAAPASTQSVRIAVPKAPAKSQSATAEKPAKAIAGRQILQRAKEDAPGIRPENRFGRRQYHYPNHKTPSANPASWEAGHGINTQYAHLLQQTTTDHESGSSSDMPEMPEWVKARVKYACQRLTPKTNPNETFIALLQEIKLARELTRDEVGVRAYSTSIASLAAYPHKLSHPKEILKLPGCENKVANLWIEWKNTGKIQAVEDLRADEDMKTLRLFYNIWGVGATTAREFYFDRGWRDLDDIVEFGWSTLARVQQIGVKYYDEFQDLIPRAEVESIRQVIHQHGVKIRDDGIQSMIVGGYRRGKEASGDVDVIVSHPDERMTLNLINDIVNSLGDEDWITHTLTLSEASSKRDQQVLPFRSGGGGHGFDTLDKALVVWQDPNWATKTEDLAADAKAKNPNIHRRVDIIIAPWRTVGCAVVGWSGGTTFERDLRRYAKNTKGWKFDSSGVRDRGNGEVVDLEGYFGWKGKEGVEVRTKTMEEAEKRVFEGFGLVYREPWERCTG